MVFMAERPDRLFNYSIYMIVKGEGITNSDPKYFQFVHTLDAEYFIGISELSFLSWVTNNHFLRLCVV